MNHPDDYDRGLRGEPTSQASAAARAVEAVELVRRSGSPKVTPSPRAFASIADLGAGDAAPKNGAAVPGGDRTPESPTHKRLPVVVRLSDVAPQEVSYLLHPYLPRGKLTMLEGDPSAGKTWVALALAAAATTGAGFLGEDGRRLPPCDPATVLYMSLEDGLADTLRPRSDSLGGNPSRVIVLKGWRDDGDEQGRLRSFTLSDVDILEAVLAEHRPVLAVIDPLQSFLGAGVDLHRCNETRPILDGLGALAERHGCALLLIRHLSKAPAAKALYRGLGSIDLTGAARSVLLAGMCPTTGKRAIVQTKASCAPAGRALGYELGRDGFRWTGISALSAADLLAPEAERGTAKGDGAALLRELLAEGPRLASEVQEAAKAAGLSERTLDRAKRDAGVTAFQRGRRWFWTLGDPPDDGPDPSERQGATQTGHGPEP